MSFVYKHELGGELVNQPLSPVSQYTTIEGPLSWLDNYLESSTLLILPNFGRTASYLKVEDQSSLQFISFPSLTFLGAGLYFTQNEVLTAISLPSLTYVAAVDNSINLDHNPQLTFVSLPVLQYLPAAAAGNILICGNSETFRVPASISDHWQGHQCYVMDGAICPSGWNNCPE